MKKMIFLLTLLMSTPSFAKTGVDDICQMLKTLEISNLADALVAHQNMKELEGSPENNLFKIVGAREKRDEKIRQASTYSIVILSRCKGWF